MVDDWHSTHSSPEQTNCQIFNKKWLYKFLAAFLLIGLIAILAMAINSDGGRSSKIAKILADDKSLIGITKDDVMSLLGPPDAICGPNSWWSISNPDAKEDLSALHFYYDEQHNIRDIHLSDSRASANELVPLNLESYGSEDPKTQHGMHLNLVDLFKNGKLPDELRNRRDVECFFPKAYFVEYWTYRKGFLEFTSMDVDFNSDGKVESVREDF